IVFVTPENISGRAAVSDFRRETASRDATLVLPCCQAAGVRERLHTNSAFMEVWAPPEVGRPLLGTGISLSPLTCVGERVSSGSCFQLQSAERKDPSSYIHRRHIG